jgi:flagellar motility protein MotE (MotC chaperone)
VGWLFQSGHLNREKITTIKQTVFDGPATQPAETQPAAPEGPPPASQRLSDLLAKYAPGKSTTEKVDFIQQNLDSAAAQLDRREREVADREAQVALANAKLADDRKLLDADRQQLADREKQDDKLANDKGFQDTLNLYNTMTSRQVKTIFMSMDETSAAEYLDAMTPRAAAKILKEFKSPAEVDRLKSIMEKMRHPPGGPATPATQETPP